VEPATSGRRRGDDLEDQQVAEALKATGRAVDAAPAAAADEEGPRNGPHTAACGARDDALHQAWNSAHTGAGDPSLQNFRVPLHQPESEHERDQRHCGLLKSCDWRIQLDNRKSWVLLPPRNHARLVPFVSWMLMGIGANIDLQVRIQGGCCFALASRFESPSTHYMHLSVPQRAAHTTTTYRYPNMLV
jgi:hypothetical protein